MRDYVCISLYTAARKGNVLAMAWKDINWEKRLGKFQILKMGNRM
ncbi:hypothetical protein RAT170B_1545 [Rickettsia argasii T170-B]|uniref:Phage integrase family protein n=1 Tax=Rickettsia argasii T170-B TaxID=1268837 RepID=A0A0F3RCK0_9RICK|nr:hypothetical protein RAT170B_1545 [Rickettsia argasii T170-B]